MDYNIFRLFLEPIIHMSNPSAANSYASFSPIPALPPVITTQLLPYSSINARLLIIMCLYMKYISQYIIGTSINIIAISPSTYVHNFTPIFYLYLPFFYIKLI